MQNRVNSRLLVRIVGTLVLLCSLSSAQSWKLFWSDEFDCPTPSATGAKYSLNTSTWEYEVGFIRNNEAQWYDTSINNSWIEPNVNVSLPTTNCHLVIQALNSPQTAVNGHQLTSASIFTKQAFRYGRIEASLRVPTGHDGTWPAFWLLGTSNNVLGWPYCGELDVMENVGFTPNINYQTIHDARNNAWRGNDISNNVLVPNMSSRFVVYALEWTPWQLQFFTDGSPLLTVPRPRPDSNPPFWALDSCWVGSWPYDQDAGFQIKLNLAIGGSWGGQHNIDPNMFPVQYHADYVRVYHSDVDPTPPMCNTVNNTILVVVDFFTNSATSSQAVAANVLQSMTGNGAMALQLLNHTTMALTESFRTIGNGSNAALIDPSNDIVVHGISPMFPDGPQGILPAGAFALRLVVNATVNISSELIQQYVFPSLSGAIGASSMLSDLGTLLCASVVDGGCKVLLAGVGSSFQVAAALPTYSKLLSLRGGCENPNRCEFPATLGCVLPIAPGNSAVCEVGASLFDFGGPEVAYHDSTPWNECQAQDPSQVVYPRSPPDWVDVTVTNTIPAVGYTVPGEWVGYSRVWSMPQPSSCAEWASASISATYSNGVNTAAYINVFVTTLYATGDASVPWSAGPEMFAGSIALYTTGSWSTFLQSTPISIVSVLPKIPNKTAFDLSLRIVFPNGGVNFNQLTLTAACSTAGQQAPSPTPTASGWSDWKIGVCVAGGALVVVLVGVIAKRVILTRRPHSDDYSALNEEVKGV